MSEQKESPLKTTSDNTLVQRPEQYLAEIDKTRFIRLIQTKNVPHCTILNGECGTFPEKAALLLAQGLNCSNSENQPCGTCHNCHTNLTDNSPDVHVYACDGTIKIEHIKPIQEIIKYGPSQMPHKVVIVPNAHTMTLQASNAFLKTLEEPPKNVHFILTTHNASQLYTTIQSRSQIIHLTPLHNDKILDLLTAQFPEKKTELATFHHQYPDLIYLIATQPDILTESYYDIPDINTTTDAFRISSELAQNKTLAKTHCMLWIYSLWKRYTTHPSPQLLARINALITFYHNCDSNLNLKLHLEKQTLSLMNAFS